MRFFSKTIARARDGRPGANVFEPTELSIGRVYKVQWKKLKPNLEELARLYRVERLTQRQLAEKMGTRRSTVARAAKAFRLDFEELKK